jgi:hypothetical protein
MTLTFTKICHYIPVLVKVGHKLIRILREDIRAFWRAFLA